MSTINLEPNYFNQQHYDSLIIGDTGVIVDFLSSGLMKLTTDLPTNPIDRTVIVENTYKFVLGLEGLVNWYSENNACSGYKHIVNYTNQRMHSFRQAIFKSLEDVSQVRIYKLTHIEDDEFHYEINLPNLVYSIAHLRREMSYEELLGIRFFYILASAKNYFQINS